MIRPPPTSTFLPYTTLFPSLHQIFTRNIQGSFPIYPVSLSLLVFTPTAATVTLVKFDPRCHVNQITRKRHVGPPPNFLSGIWAPYSVYTVRSEERRVGKECRS